MIYESNKNKIRRSTNKQLEGIMVNDLDESIRPRELMHVQLYAPLYQRIGSEMSGAGPQTSKYDTLLLAGGADKGAKVMTRATSMPEMCAELRSSPLNNVDNDSCFYVDDSSDSTLDNDVPNTLYVVVEGAKVMTRATSMPKMVLSRAPPLHCSVDNDDDDSSCFYVDDSSDGPFDKDVPKTLYGVVHEREKAVCSGGIVGGMQRSKSVASITSKSVASITTTTASEEVSQLTDSSHGE
jgi:hypothetical protein